MTTKKTEARTFTPILLPLAIVANLALSLFLIERTRTAEDLKSQIEEGQALRQSLSAELPALQAKVSELRMQRPSLEAEVKSLEARKTEAQALVAQIDHLRGSEKLLSATIQTQRQTNADQTEALAAITKSAAAANAMAKDAESKIPSLTQQVTELEIKVRNLNKSAQEQERQLMSRTAALDATNAEIERGKRIVADRASEIDSLNRQLAGLSKQKADWNEVTRMQAEKADLGAKVSGLREDLKAAENSLGALERRRDELTKTVDQLAKQKTELERALNSTRNANEKK